MSIDEIKDYVERMGSDNLRVFGGTYEGGINLQQVPDEISQCIQGLLGFKIKNFLEIGSAAGGNAFMFNNFFKFENLVIIDDNEHPKHKLREQTLSYIPHEEFIGDSHSRESLDFIKSLDMKFDVLFIDADHSYEGVKKDTEMYSEFVFNGGLVIYHDVAVMVGVKKFFNEMKEQNDYGLEFLNSYVSAGHKRKSGIGIMIKREIA